MKIYAIIVTYNAMRRNWADRCLKSLQNSTFRHTIQMPYGYHRAITLDSARPTTSESAMS